MGRLATSAKLIHSPISALTWADIGAAGLDRLRTALAAALAALKYVELTKHVFSYTKN
jgi:hypothetical protein